MLAIDLPVPSGATAGEFWSSARAHDGVYLAFLVSFLTIAVAWSHHHDAFKYARRSDSWLRNATMIWLLTIILIPFATKLLTGYGHDALTVHALRWGFYALLQTVQAAALFAMTRHMAAHDLGRADAAGQAGAERLGLVRDHTRLRAVDPGVLRDDLRVGALDRHADSGRAGGPRRRRGAEISSDGA